MCPAETPKTVTYTMYMLISALPLLNLFHSQELFLIHQRYLECALFLSINVHSQPEEVPIKFCSQNVLPSSS